jgi:hypothetical protein
MKKQIKKLWVEALRSGGFKQGREKMKQGSGADARHCCLGVLEEVRVATTGGGFTRGAGPDCQLLSRTTQEWAGLDTSDPVLMPLRAKTASELNDDGKSFAFIARQIEKYL